MTSETSKTAGRPAVWALHDDNPQGYEVSLHTSEDGAYAAALQRIKALVADGACDDEEGDLAGAIEAGSGRAALDVFEELICNHGGDATGDVYLWITRQEVHGGSAPGAQVQMIPGAPVQTTPLTREQIEAARQTAHDQEMPALVPIDLATLNALCDTAILGLGAIERLNAIRSLKSFDTPAPEDAPPTREQVMRVEASVRMLQRTMDRLIAQEEGKGRGSALRDSEDAESCPDCGASCRDSKIGIELRGVYDGVIVWQCLECRTMRHRFTGEKVDDLRTVTKKGVKS